jgi:hypothetical protein
MIANTELEATVVAYYKALSRLLSPTGRTTTTSLYPSPSRDLNEVRSEYEKYSYPHRMAFGVVLLMGLKTNCIHILSAKYHLSHVNHIH